MNHASARRQSRRIFVALAFVACVAAADARVAAIVHGAEPSIQVVFRYDDPSTISNTQIEELVFASFARHDVPLAIGVVPYPSLEVQQEPSTPDQRTVPLSEEKAAFLRKYLEQGTIEVALHGCTHQTWRPAPLSEFAGLPMDEQVRKLTSGKQLLEQMLGVKVDVFVPPWNRIDETTVAAMAAAGMSCISADARRGAVDAATSVRYAPQSCYLWEVEDAVRQARTLDDAAPVIVALFHEYDFHESQSPKATIGLERLDAALEWLGEQQDVRIVTFGTLMAENADLDAERFLAFQQAVTPPGWTLRPLATEPLVYLSTANSHQLVQKVEVQSAGAIAAFAIVALAAGWLAGRGIRGVIPRGAAPAELLSLVLLAAVVAYAFRDGSASGMGLAASTTIGAAWIGLVGSRLRRGPRGMPHDGSLAAA